MSVATRACAWLPQSLLSSGLRIGELCRLRLQDINLTKQSLFVGLPNKGNRERNAFFADLTNRFYHEWIKERDPECNHDYLFHNTRGNPCTVPSLIHEFCRVLCKIHKGKKVHETGFDKWSTHKLRHTMASNMVSAGADAATIIGPGGWNSYQAMCGYARVDVDVARRGYDEATKRARNQARVAPGKKTLSLSEFLDRKREGIVAIKQSNTYGTWRVNVITRNVLSPMSGEPRTRDSKGALMDFEPFLTHWQTNKNCSTQTIRSYRNDLKLFEAFLHSRSISRVNQLDHQVINEYIESMKLKANPRFGRIGLSDSSIARRLAAISSYLEYVRGRAIPRSETRFATLRTGAGRTKFRNR